MSDNKRIDELRSRRSHILKEPELKERRELHGHGMVVALTNAIDHDVTLSDFQVDRLPPFAIDWPRRLDEASGLVAAYVTKDRAKLIAICIQAKLHEFRGMIGIYGNEFLGLANVSQVRIPGMIEACEAANDSVAFYPKGIDGAIVFDCYKSPPGAPPFSVLIQGAALTELLANCMVSG